MVDCHMKILTVDIGGSFIKYARMTEEMEILSRGKLPTPQSRREALMWMNGQICTLWESCFMRC